MPSFPLRVYLNGRQIRSTFAESGPDAETVASAAKRYFENEGWTVTVEIAELPRFAGSEPETTIVVRCTR